MHNTAASRAEPRSIALLITEHIRLNPFAQDTVEGISDWWLSGISVTRTDVEQALQGLVASGVLRQRRRADGKIYYCKASRPDKND